MARQNEGQLHTQLEENNLMELKMLVVLEGKRGLERGDGPRKRPAAPHAAGASASQRDAGGYDALARVGNNGSFPCLLHTCATVFV